MSYAKRADKNQPDVVAELRAYGYTVHHLHTLGSGFPDLLVGGLDSKGEPVTLLVEVKSPTGKLTPKQVEWIAGWRGMPVIVAHSASDVLRAIGREVA